MEQQGNFLSRNVSERGPRLGVAVIHTCIHESHPKPLVEWKTLFTCRRWQSANRTKHTLHPKEKEPHTRMYGVPHYSSRVRPDTWRNSGQRKQKSKKALPGTVQVVHSSNDSMRPSSPSKYRCITRTVLLWDKHARPWSSCMCTPHFVTWRFQTSRWNVMYHRSIDHIQNSNTAEP